MIDCRLMNYEGWSDGGDAFSGENSSSPSKMLQKIECCDAQRTPHKKNIQEQNEFFQLHFVLNYVLSAFSGGVAPWLF